MLTDWRYASFVFGRGRGFSWLEEEEEEEVEVCVVNLFGRRFGGSGGVGMGVGAIAFSRACRDCCCKM